MLRGVLRGLGGADPVLADNRRQPGREGGHEGCQGVAERRVLVGQPGHEGVARPAQQDGNHEQEQVADRNRETIKHDFQPSKLYP